MTRLRDRASTRKSKKSWRPDAAAARAAGIAAIAVLILASCGKISPRKLTALTSAIYGEKVVPETIAYAHISDNAIDKPAAREGLSIFLQTKKFLPAHVGNALSCASCHTSGGRIPFQLSLVGAVNRFPRYLARDGRVIDLRRRIEDCIERSERGRDIAPNGAAMNALIAYLSFISRNARPGEIGYGYGLYPSPLPTDGSSARGGAVYAAKCAACHRADGQGKKIADVVVVPPLWGDESFTREAGLARPDKLARFVYAAMPFGAGFSLTKREAADVAAFVLSHPRAAASIPPR